MVPEQAPNQELINNNLKIEQLMFIVNQLKDIYGENTRIMSVSYTHLTLPTTPYV